jgi:hypothetical protein
MEALIMGSTRTARLHWQEMVWYGWILSSALVLAGHPSALGHLNRLICLEGAEQATKASQSCK